MTTVLQYAIIPIQEAVCIMRNPFENLSRFHKRKALEEDLERRTREEKEKQKIQLNDRRKKHLEGEWKKHNHMVKGILKSFGKAVFPGDHIEDRKEWNNDSWSLGWELGRTEKWEPGPDERGTHPDNYLETHASVFILFDESDNPEAFNVHVGLERKKIGLSKDELTETLGELYLTQQSRDARNRNR